MALTIALAILPIADRQVVWWRSTGGLVVQDTHTCSMVLTEQRDMVVISWDKESTESLAFVAPEPVTAQSPALVRFDSTIIGETNLNSNGIPILLTGRDLDDLLREADQITADVPDHPFIIPINRSKMAALLTARDKCRAALR